MRYAASTADLTDSTQKTVKIDYGCLPVSTFLYSRVFKLDSHLAPILYLGDLQSPCPY